MSTGEKAPARAPSTAVVLSPGEAAVRSGIALADLVAMIRRHRYAYTEIKPGGKPGDRGRNRWGLTVAQLDAILKGQARAFAPPGPEGPHPAAPTPSSPDGKSRLRRRGVRI